MHLKGVSAHGRGHPPTQTNRLPNAPAIPPMYFAYQMVIPILISDIQGCPAEPARPDLQPEHGVQDGHVWGEGECRSGSVPDGGGQAVGPPRRQKGN